MHLRLSAGHAERAGSSRHSCDSTIDSSERPTCEFALKMPERANGAMRRPASSPARGRRQFGPAGEETPRRRP
jgi:hypothetical protein